MAFCTSCGTQVDPQNAACPKCGASLPGAAASPVAAAPGALQPPVRPTQGSSSALRIVLIIVAIMVGLGVLCAGIVGYVGWRVARRVRVEQHDGRTTVNTPFGKVTTEDGDVAKSLEVEIYPGARQLPGGSSVQMGQLNTANAEFESDDPPAKVAEFYRNQYPDANIAAAHGDEHTILVSHGDNLVTIHVEGRGSGSTIHISRMTGKNLPRPPAPHAERESETN